MNINELTTLPENPTVQQLNSIDTILGASDPLENLRLCLTDPDVPGPTRNWIWSLVFAGTLHCRVLADSKGSEELPSAMAKQLNSYLQYIEEYGFMLSFESFGKIGTIPADSREHVWKLLVSSLKHSHMLRGEAGRYLKESVSKQLLEQAPNSPHYQAFVGLARSGNYDSFHDFGEVWKLMTNPKVPVWARKHFVAKFLESGEPKLPESYYAHSGLEDKSQQTATTDFVDRIIRETSSTEVDACVQEFLLWLIKTGQGNFLAGLAHWRRWSPGFLGLVLDRSPEDFRWAVEYILYQPYDCSGSKNDRNFLEDQTMPEEIGEDIILSLRGMLTILGDSKLLARADELLEMRINRDRSNRDRRREYEVRDANQAEETKQASVSAVTARHSLIT